LAVDHAHLQQILDPVEALENELIACVKLDARLPVDALSTQLCAELALGLVSITS
jgi:hypothetical protein